MAKRKQPQLSKLAHPMQPIGFDESNTVRFKQNAIVRFLLDACSAGYKFNLNDLAIHMQVGGERFAPGPPVDGRYDPTTGRFDKVPFRVPTKPFSKEDYTHLMQLIGYSTSGFGELSRANKKVVATADAEADKIWKAAEKT